MNIFPNRVAPGHGIDAGIVLLTMLLGMGGLTSAPLPPLGKTDVTGTIEDARWVPEVTLKGKAGFSGSLGRDRVIPAHFVVTLRDYSGPTVRQAWMMNGFVGVKSTDKEGRDKLPPTLVVWVNSGDRGQLKAGIRIRLVNYTVSGDEGGTWASCEGVEFPEQTPSPEANNLKVDAIPQNFKAHIGGRLGLTCRVELTDGILVYSSSRGREDSDPVKVTPTADQWREFRAALDQVGVWRWEADYMNRKVMDGTQWSLEIGYSDRALKTAGSNCYPDDDGKPNGEPQSTEAFGRYLAAVAKVLGNRTFK